MSENDNVNQPTESGTTTPPEVPSDNPEQAPQPQEEKVTIPSDVEELLEKISSANPVGIDIGTTDVSEAISLSMDLEGEMEKRRDNDYPGCVKWAKALLSQHSKDLRIATLLSIAWFRTEGLSGLNKGFILLAELLNRFGEKCYPPGKTKQVQVFSVLNNDPRLQSLKKISFEAEKPVFKVTAEILESAAAKELPREILFKITKFKDKSIVGDNQFITDLKNELFPKDAKKIELIEKNKDKLLQVFKESKATEIQTQFSITDRFMKIVASIADIDQHRDIFLELKDEKYLSAERFSDELKQRFKDNGVALNVVEPFQPLFDCLGNNNIAFLLDLKSGYEQLLKTVKAYFSEERPELSNLSDLIGKPTQIAEKLVDDTIKNILENRKKTEPKPVSAPEPAPGPEPGPKSEPSPEPGPRPAAAVRPVAGPRPIPGPAGEATVQSLVIKRDTEAISVIKKAISYYFVEEKSIPTPDNKIKKEKVFKVPSDP
ncbi:type VI secretion system ImpA family N-terminal domain-containing protein, partial [candidate division KSB1 bacterium]|nr:type VI secretion system ImpA family N-terminal domain-containing protein [candidate division KSB1 bacterium]